MHRLKSFDGGMTSKHLVKGTYGHLTELQIEDFSKTDDWTDFEKGFLRHLKLSMKQTEENSLTMKKKFSRRL